MYIIFKWTHIVYKNRTLKTETQQSIVMCILFYDILIKRKLTINTREMSMPGNYISSYMKKKEEQCLNI